MSYCLENEKEYDRLEKQNTFLGYDPNDELKFIETVNKSTKLLDAGCGSGAIIKRAMAKWPELDITGIDVEQSRLNRLEAEVQSTKVDLYRSSIEDLPFKDNTFDYVTCRFVLEHVKEPIMGLRELRRVLKPGGKLIVTDMDGMIFNVFSLNVHLMSSLQKLKREFQFDLFIARKLPILLETSGFTAVDHEISLVHPKGQDRENEINLIRDRLYFSRLLIQKTLGNSQGDHFIETYLSELKNPNTTLFYNKFIVCGTKEGENV